MSERPRANPALRLAFIRQIHVYVSALIAPSLLMFAISGGLQVYRLQESHPNYKPLPIVEKMGRLHKDSVFAAAPKRERPEGAAPAKAGGEAAKAPPKKREKPLGVKLMQAYFAFVSVGLVVSTGLGVWMGLMYNRRKGLVLAALLSGIALPVIFTLMS
ncbi:MAG: hypothetical protein CFE28_11330 [Alphaproteobacteria bacterium PA2]|nr:MAG: hypothetical protein CFE28_11330 [Alphaproteobacteria bacterium PA2]